MTTAHPHPRRVRVAARCSPSAASASCGGKVRTLRGFIRARDGSHDSILFTAADIEGGATLTVGDIVECVVDESPYGPVARKIRRIQSGEPGPH